VAESDDRPFVIFSQTFVPDPAAVGQYIADVAAAMADRGHRVVVFASSRGYDDHTRKYPLRERRDGYEIIRIPWSSFGKKSIPRRVAGTASFISQVLLRGLLVRKPKGLLFSTSPPLVGFAGNLVRRFKNVPTTYWAMDLNPDQLIALGKLRPESRVAKVLERTNRWILDRAALVVALDHFMADRLRPRTQDLDDRLLVIPPWPQETFVEPVAHADNPFRKEHGLEGKFVVMYSGNHSPANPLDTLLAAAERLRNDDRFRFLFVGGGVQKPEVEAFVRDHKLTNAVCLPYQPMASLRYSLSAADTHVVSLGGEMVGIIHPCKVYGSMAVARPVLFFGPKPSHVSDLIDRHPIGRHVLHGDVDAAVVTLRELADMPEVDRMRMGQVGRDVLNDQLSQAKPCGEMCDRIEATMAP
jgi:hypothetical protein